MFKRTSEHLGHINATDGFYVLVPRFSQREGPPEYSGKMLGLSIQGIQAEYSAGSEDDENNFHRDMNRKKETKKRNMKLKEAGHSVE